MSDMTESALAKAIGRLKDVKVLVVGDIMLDVWCYTKSFRKTKEFGREDPIHDIERTEYLLGGAGNVARACWDLGSRVSILGLVGDDQDGRHVETLLSILLSHNIIVDKTRPTTKKMRVIDEELQSQRFDWESREPIREDLEKLVIARIGEIISRFDVVLISDYHKGLLTDKILQSLLTRNALTIVDPKGQDFKRYYGASIIKANQAELKPNYRAPELHKDTGATVVTTKGAEGMEFFNPITDTVRFKPFDVKVVDAIGAGDVTLAALGVALASKLTILEAVAIANLAASTSVTKRGAQGVTKEEMLKVATLCKFS